MATFNEGCGKLTPHGPHSRPHRHTEWQGLRRVTITDTYRCKGVKGFAKPGQRRRRNGRL